MKYSFKGDYNPAIVYENGDCVFGPDDNLYYLEGAAPAGSLHADVHWHQVRKELKEAAELISSAISDAADNLQSQIDELDERVDALETDVGDLDDRVTALEEGGEE